MQFWFAAATSIVTCLAVINLTLTIGLVYRLRSHSSLIQALMADRFNLSPDLAGQVVLPWDQTVNVDGWWLFLDSECHACPAAVDALRSANEDLRTWNVVIVGNSDKARRMTDKLSEIPQALLRSVPIDAVRDSFGVDRFPTFLKTKNGVVEWAGLEYPAQV
jgi:hypothetical protein